MASLSFFLLSVSDYYQRADTLTMCPQELCGGTIGSGGSPQGVRVLPTGCVRWVAMRTAEGDAGKPKVYSR